MLRRFWTDPGSIDDAIALRPVPSGGVDVLSSGSPRGILRIVIMSKDSLRSERDGAKNTKN